MKRRNIKTSLSKAGSGQYLNDIIDNVSPQKNIHKAIWESYDDKTWNQMDHVLITARYPRNISDVKSVKEAEAG